MGILLLVLGVFMVLGGGAAALSRLTKSEHEGKKSPFVPLIIAGVGVVLAIIGFIQNIGA